MNARFDRLLRLGLALLPLAAGAVPARAANGSGAIPAARPSAAATATASVSPSPSPSPRASAAREYPIDAPLGGPQSPYTAPLLRLLKTWPPRDIDYAAVAREANPVSIRCIGTPGEKYYIGLEQAMLVEAPVSRVAAILDDIAHYKDLFPDYDDIHLESRDANLLTVYWEQHIPLFFVPNVKYWVDYLVDSTSPGRRIYRYKLKRSEKLKTNDGIIVLESAGPLRTRYTEYDFYDARWGPLTTLAPGRIWKDSVEGIYLSDVAIKLRAENPDWSYERIGKESRGILDKFPVDAALAQRKAFNPFGGEAGKENGSRPEGTAAVSD